jgi:hypothetical protein
VVLPAWVTGRRAVVDAAEKVSRPVRAAVKGFGAAFTAADVPDGPVGGSAVNHGESDVVTQDSAFVSGVTWTVSPAPDAAHVDWGRAIAARPWYWVTVRVADAPAVVNVITPRRSTAVGLAGTLTVTGACEAPDAGSTVSHGASEVAVQAAPSVMGLTTMDLALLVAIHSVTSKNGTAVGNLP